MAKLPCKYTSLSRPSIESNNVASPVTEISLKLAVLVFFGAVTGVKQKQNSSKVDDVATGDSGISIGALAECSTESSSSPLMKSVGTWIGLSPFDSLERLFWMLSTLAQRLPGYHVFFHLTQGPLALTF